MFWFKRKVQPTSVAIKERLQEIWDEIELIHQRVDDIDRSQKSLSKDEYEALYHKRLAYTLKWSKPGGTREEVDKLLKIHLE